MLQNGMKINNIYYIFTLLLFTQMIKYTFQYFIQNWSLATNFISNIKVQIQWKFTCQ